MKINEIREPPYLRHENKQSITLGLFFYYFRGGDKGSAALNGLCPCQAARLRKQETTKMLAFRVRSL